MYVIEDNIKLQSYITPIKQINNKTGTPTLPLKQQQNLYNPAFNQDARRDKRSFSLTK